MWACRDAGFRYMRIQDVGNRGRGCRGPDLNAAGLGFSGMRTPRGAGVPGVGSPGMGVSANGHPDDAGGRSWSGMKMTGRHEG